jgi:hypothetical protein
MNLRNVCRGRDRRLRGIRAAGPESVAPGQRPGPDADSDRDSDFGAQTRECRVVSAAS